MEGKFTERANKAIILAQEVAQHYSQNYVGTEHLLLGLLHEGGDIAIKVLNNLGINPKTVQDKLVRTMGPTEKQDSLLGFTPRMKKVFELSFAEAREMGHNYIGTEHLLLGLIREGEGLRGRVDSGHPPTCRSFLGSLLSQGKDRGADSDRGEGGRRPEALEGLLQLARLSGRWLPVGQALRGRRNLQGRQHPCQGHVLAGTHAGFHHLCDRRRCLRP